MLPFGINELPHFQAEDPLHRTASGWWLMVMNRGDSGF
jgi:hypothetical protein